MKKHILTLIICSAFLMACNKGSSDEKAAEQIAELENIEHDLDETIEKLEAEEADLKHDLDSLLKDI